VSRDVKFKEDLASRKSHEPILVTEDGEMEALKVEPRSLVTSIAIQQPLGEEDEIVSPYTFVRIP
jgi:hypothetical protein